MYRWRGKIAADSESPMLIKTTAANIPALKDAIRRLHPYDTPELIFLRVQDGLPDYLQWVQEECESQKD